MLSADRVQRLRALRQGRHALAILVGFRFNIEEYQSVNDGERGGCCQEGQQMSAEQRAHLDSSGQWSSESEPLPTDEIARK